MYEVYINETGCLNIKLNELISLSRATSLESWGSFLAKP
jgi:hypothetical protein